MKQLVMISILGTCLINIDSFFLFFSIDIMSSSFLQIEQVTHNLFAKIDYITL